MGTSRRPSEPEKVPAPVPARPSALELKVEELEEKGKRGGREKPGKMSGEEQDTGGKICF